MIHPTNVASEPYNRTREKHHAEHGDGNGITIYEHRVSCSQPREGLYHVHLLEGEIKLRQVCWECERSKRARLVKLDMFGKGRGVVLDSRERKLDALQPTFMREDERTREGGHRAGRRTGNR